MFPSLLFFRSIAIPLLLHSSSTLKQFPYSCFYIHLSRSLLQYSFSTVFLCPFHNLSSRHTLAIAEKRLEFSRILATTHCVFSMSKSSRLLFIRRSFTCLSNGNEKLSYPRYFDFHSGSQIYMKFEFVCLCRLVE